MQPFVADDAGKSEMPVRGEQGTSGGAQSEGGPYSPPGEPPQRRDVNTILTVFADRRRRDSRRRLIFRVLVFLNLSESIALIFLTYQIFCLTRSEEHTSELQSLMRISYAVFCLQKNNKTITINSQYSSWRCHRTE